MSNKVYIIEMNFEDEFFDGIDSIYLNEDDALSRWRELCEIAENVRKCGACPYNAEYYTQETDFGLEVFLSKCPKFVPLRDDGQVVGCNYKYANVSPFYPTLRKYNLNERMYFTDDVTKEKYK